MISSRQSVLASSSRPELWGAYSATADRKSAAPTMSSSPTRFDMFTEPVYWMKEPSRPSFVSIRMTPFAPRDP